jgi:hypothetical protein
MSGENIKRVSLYLAPEEYELLRKVAYDQHVKLNDVARQLIQSISGHAVLVQKAA